MGTFVTIVHVATCVLLVLVVLIQSGKGAEISASFGGSSQTVFGSSGGQNFFTKFTYALAAVFMVTSVLLTVRGNDGRKSVFEGVPQAAAPVTAPVAPAAPAAPQSEAPKK